MKEIMAVIRMNMINKTKEALLKEGFPSMTCRRVNGRGKQKVDFSIVEKMVANETGTLSPITAEVVSESQRLVPKRLITLIVKDEEAEKVIETIIQTNSFGQPGDGKIFVLPVQEAYRVRTGEYGEDAV